MELRLESLKVAAATFIDALNPDDAAMVVSFDSRTYLASDLTRDRARAGRAVLALDAGGNTSRLYDALVATAERLAPIPGRKAMLLLTDGLDVDSGAADAESARATPWRLDVGELNCGRTDGRGQSRALLLGHGFSKSARRVTRVIRPSLFTAIIRRRGRSPSKVPSSEETVLRS